MKRRVFIVAMSALILFCLSGSESHAQRHISGQHVVSVDAFAWKQYGGGISWGMYGLYGRSLFGVSFLTGPSEPYTVPATKTAEEATYDVLSRDWFASGGYLFRIVGNRSRSLNLLLGGTVDLGARVHVVPEGSAGVPKAKFIYGVSPVIQMEYFPDTNIALNLHFRPRFQLYGHKVFERVFYPEFGIGCSFYIL